jgi:acetyl-CoA C-acetyltransferase
MPAPHVPKSKSRRSGAGGDDAFRDEPVLFTINGSIAILAIQRPHVRNAIDHVTALAIEKRIDQFEADPSLHVLGLTGAAGAFSAGADSRAAAAGNPPTRTPGRGWFGMNERRPKKPVIAAVEGFVIGGGCELALACDLIVAAEDARFALPEVSRSLAPAGDGLLRLPRRLPFNVAMEMVLTGDPQPAARLHVLGLVNRLSVPGKARLRMRWYWPSGSRAIRPSQFAPTNNCSIVG